MAAGRHLRVAPAHMETLGCLFRITHCGTVQQVALLLDCTPIISVLCVGSMRLEKENQKQINLKISTLSSGDLEGVTR